ncbi:hypothetical protein ASF91_07970 [Rhizobium sp. Leaf155]|nr:hypothetical protein ASF91_07970 [Rhizobium sp. Leaf155]
MLKRDHRGVSHMHWREDLNINTNKLSLTQAVIRYFISPSFKVVTRYRMYRWLYQRGLLGRILHKPLFVANVKMGAYISPKAVIGKGFHLPHPVGIVIGEGVKLGDNVTIFQGVTLGVSKEGKGDYPTLSNDVTVYANSVLVGEINVGPGAQVAALSFVNEDVPGGMVAAGSPATMRNPRDRLPVSLNG